KAAGGKVSLVKMNIDEHPQIAGQLGVQSIPAVIAFQKGQPVDGFMGAVPESQIKGFLERLVGPLGSEGEEIVAEAESALGAGDPADYQGRFDLALALNAGGRRSEAADALLEIIRRDRTWNEDGARKQLLQFFEAWGPMDPAAMSARRKLSGLLFS